MSPLIQAETLELLEWSRLCQQLSTFAATKLGMMATQRLVIPSSQVESLALLTQTREMVYLEMTLAPGLQFSGLEDIWEPLERAERKGILSGDQLLNVATTFAAARQLRRTIDAQDEADVPVLQQLVAELRTYPELEQEIHRCIDDNGKVADRANPKLAGIRENLKELRQRIQQNLQRLMQRHSNALQETVITMRGDRFVLPIKSSHKDVIPGIVHDASTSGSTLYVEPQSLVSLGNQLRQSQRQEQVEEEKIRAVLTEKIAEIIPDIERLLVICTTLDLAAARARYSLWLGANPPRFVDRTAQEKVILRQLRHPLLVWQQHHEDGPAVVPIDLMIQPQIRVVAITGPNTGGKTVTLKTLGIAALMAKVGLYIPAREPVEIPWFDQILADIGDEQSLQQSLSTFSGHIRRISRILDALTPDPIESDSFAEIVKEAQPELEEAIAQPLLPSTDNFPDLEADPHSILDESSTNITELSDKTHSPTPPLPLSPTTLVLLDEVGAGTDPSEGSALAIALLKHLAAHAELTIATTHFGELKSLKYQDERFENASVEFDDVSLSPTYRLLWGIPGRSNALAIASRLGLDATVINQAREYVGLQSSDDVNQVIAGLEEQRRQQEAKANEAANLVRQAEQLHDEVARKANLLKKREQALQRQQDKEIQNAIAQAKGEIAKVIRTLQQAPTAQEARRATAEIDRIAAQQEAQRKPPKKKVGFVPKVGDRVRIPRIDQVAEVLTNPDADGELSVRFGLMKMTVALADVESLQGVRADVPEPAKSTAKPSSETKKAASETSPSQPAIRTSRNTLDLRGSRVADAEVEVDRAIASANGSPLWIIHGHGTGKLRRGVQDFLKQHPQVERYEPAEKADGGSGVTVAYVK
ncbi:MAG: endonuclease MutS2 [Leptolyngbyaceae bacterium]|nr:endonuclease MutS2 [Leptolyngbyaceae bacterium]